jgi:hypothetical protein
MLETGGTGCVQYPDLLASDDYTYYIKDPFNKDKTLHYLGVTLPSYRAPETKGDHSYPPYGITYESLTYNIGMLERQVQLIDVRHYNAYLLVPRLVYHLSTKLKNNAIHNRIGQAEEVKLISFLQGTGMLQEQHHFVSSMGHIESTQTCRT